MAFRHGLFLRTFDTFLKTVIENIYAGILLLQKHLQVLFQEQKILFSQLSICFVAKNL